MNKRTLITFVLMIIALFSLIIWNVSIGSVSLSIENILPILLKKECESTLFKVIYNIRLPRLFAGLFLGGALSVSGFLLQTFFSNPIAGPYVLGISSGAKLFVAMTMIFFLSKGIILNSFLMILSAFLGSMLAMGIVLLISLKVKKMSILVVCGIMIGYICSAITDFCITFASDSNIVNLHNWSLGSFSGISWTQVKIIFAIVTICLFFAFFLSKPINAYQLGENYAKNLGVNVRLLRIILILLSSLLSSCVTAFAGPISFVGIAVPHLVKSAFRTSKPLILIPSCFLGGAIITLFCDGIARTVFAPTEISISSVTAIFLVPVVIYMMIRRQKK